MSRKEEVKVNEEVEESESGRVAFRSLSHGVLSKCDSNSGAQRQSKDPKSRVYPNLLGLPPMARRVLDYQLLSFRNCEKGNIVMY